MLAKTRTNQPECKCRYGSVKVEKLQFIIVGCEERKCQNVLGLMDSIMLKVPAKNAIMNAFHELIPILHRMLKIEESKREYLKKPIQNANLVNTTMNYTKKHHKPLELELIRH